MPKLSKFPAPPNLINNQLLPNLLFSLLPESPASATPLTNLLDPAYHLLRRREGLWLVHQDPQHLTDHSGWFIIHWPSLLRNILQQPRGKSLLADHGYSAPHYFTMEQSDPAFFDTQWRAFRLHFQSLLPPASTVWQDAPDFLRLTSFAEPHEAGPDAFTVFRAGAMVSSKYRTTQSRLGAYKDFSPLNLLPILSNPELLHKIHPLTQLLLQCMQRSRVFFTEDGFNNWGFAWTKTGLIFHYARALHRAQLDPYLSPLFPGDMYNDYLSPWGADYVLNSPCALKLPRLTRFTTRLDPGAYERLVRPFNLIHNPHTFGDRWATDVKYMPEHHLYFHNKHRTQLYDLRRYVRDLCALAKPNLTVQTPTTQTPTTQTPTTLSAGKPPSNPPKKTRKRPISIFTLDERQLGYALPSSDLDNPEAIEGLTLRAIKYHREVFLSYPDALAEFAPGINNNEWFLRTPKKGQLPARWMGTVLDYQHTIPRDIQRATLMYRGTLYFHPGLTLPDGDAVSFLRACYRAQGSVPERIYQITTAYNNFLTWVHTPNALLEGAGAYGPELESFVDPSVDCPIKLSSHYERLDFFYQKGMRSSRRGLAYAVTKPGQHGSRSPRIGTYDKWCIWYATNTELPYLKYRLNKTQQTEYLAKRWLPWRRPGSLGYHLPNPLRVYLKLQQRQPDLPKDVSVDAVIAEAEDLYGASFNSY